MRIATFNVNGITSRLPALLRWLEEKQPDVACLQELKAPHEKFPEAAINDAGYEAIWHGQKSWNGVAILARGTKPVEVGRGLAGDPEDAQSRYIEAAVNGVLIAGLYLPNGNPAPGPKFDYKLAWFERLIAHAATLIESGIDAILAGDFNVVPTNADIYNWWLWRFDAVLQPETRGRYDQLLAQGWVDSTRRLHPQERDYTFWVNENAFRRNAGFRMDFLLLTPALAMRLERAQVDREHRGRERASDHASVSIELRAPRAGNESSGVGIA